MSRQVLVVGPALEPDVPMEQTFRRLGYSRITRVGSAAEALEFSARDNVDLLFLPIDLVDDAGLAAVERVSRKDRHMGVVATGPRVRPGIPAARDACRHPGIPRPASRARRALRGGGAPASPRRSPADHGTDLRHLQLEGRSWRVDDRGEPGQCPRTDPRRVAGFHSGSRYAGR